jgi:hypothetical protein
MDYILQVYRAATPAFDTNVVQYYDEINDGKHKICDIYSGETDCDVMYHYGQLVDVIMPSSKKQTMKAVLCEKLYTFYNPKTVNEVFAKFTLESCFTPQHNYAYRVDSGYLDILCRNFPDAKFLFRYYEEDCDSLFIAFVPAKEVA